MYLYSIYFMHYAKYVAIILNHSVRMGPGIATSYRVLLNALTMHDYNSVYVYMYQWK